MNTEKTMKNEIETLEVAVSNPAALARRDTDIAGLCREIVLRTAVNIQGRKYVRVEGWESIAAAHGCVAGCNSVEKIGGGFRAVAELRMVSTGHIITCAEGFVGEDEPTWFGGVTAKGNVLLKRPDYAIRAMAQTRAISRVCRSAFAHIVVLMDAGLQTTPAEEVPEEGFEDLSVTARKVPSKPVVANETQTKRADPTEEQTCTGKIEVVHEKQGTGKNGKPYTLTSLKINGEWYRTFDLKFAGLAKAFKERGADVKIWFTEKTSGKFVNRDLVAIVALDQQEALPSKQPAQGKLSGDDDDVTF
jgi:hypothetical protein